MPLHWLKYCGWLQSPPANCRQAAVSFCGGYPGETPGYLVTVFSLYGLRFLLRCPLCPQHQSPLHPLRLPHLYPLLLLYFPFRQLLWFPLPAVLFRLFRLSCFLFRRKTCVAACLQKFLMFVLHSGCLLQNSL